MEESHGPKELPKIIQKSRTKTKTVQVNKKVDYWGSQSSEILNQMKKEKDNKSRRNKNLKPTSSFECSNGCIGDLIILEQIPNLDDLLKDKRLHSNFFENIPEFNG